MCQANACDDSGRHIQFHIQTFSYLRGLLSTCRPQRLGVGDLSVFVAFLLACAMSGSNVPVQKECDIPGKSVYTIWRSDFEIDDKYVVRSSARSDLTPLSTFALLGARSSPANMHQHVHTNMCMCCQPRFSCRASRCARPHGRRDRRRPLRNAMQGPLDIEVHAAV